MESTTAQPAPSDASTVFDIDLNHKYLFFRRTKIVATIGPASSSPAMLERLIRQGLNVARINFSHGRPEDHLKVAAAIRRAAAKAGASVAILGDLCGPKIRVGQFRDGAITLKDGATVRITTRPGMGDENLIVSQYRRLAREVKPGDPILLDDGNLELKVLKVSGDIVEARVIHGGVLKNHKGMNLPDTKLAVAALTAKDRSDALYCIRGAFDYIALSFVRHPQDIADLKRLLKRENAEIPVIAKIEKPEALANIRGIVEAADGIMVARGDLGVELPTKKVPIIQNKLIQIANAGNKPVIVATQMLESMIEHSRPTRAEVTDVAGACLAGADAVMLSAETASGKYPLEAVQTMDSILRETEAYQFFSLGGRFTKAGGERANRLHTALASATAQISRDLKVRCIFVLTRSGFTARIVSSDRPAAPVVALTQSETVRRRLNLLWGVYPHLVRKTMNSQEYLRFGQALITRLKLARRGDYIVMLSGLQDRNTGTNSLLINQLA
jgi:pyruvate kinase